MQQVNFFCDQERCKIGHIDIADGQQVILSPRALAMAFVPERVDFRITGHQKTGQVFRCPRCDGSVRIEGDPDPTPIILGNTVVRALPVNMAV